MVSQAISSPISMAIEDDHNYDMSNSFSTRLSAGYNAMGMLPKAFRKKKDWTDAETLVLIDFWYENELLYNVKNPLCFNKEERNKCFEKISSSLEERNIHYSAKDIAEKISKLRNYYGAQQRLVEASKKNTIHGEEAFASKWKFFIKLDFLKNNIQPRSMKINFPSDDVITASMTSPFPTISKMHEISMHQESQQQPLISKQPKKLKFAQLAAIKQETGSNNVEKAIYRVQAINNAHEKIKSRGQNDKCEDRVFCDLIFKMLSDIPKGHDKDYLKLEIQHKILTLKHQKDGMNEQICESKQYSSERGVTYIREYERSDSSLQRLHSSDNVLDEKSHRFVSPSSYYENNIDKDNSRSNSSHSFTSMSPEHI